MNPEAFASIRSISKEFVTIHYCYDILSTALFKALFHVPLLYFKHLRHTKDFCFQLTKYVTVLLNLLIFFFWTNTHTNTHTHTHTHKHTHSHTQKDALCPLGFLSQVDFESSFQKTKNSRIIFVICDKITLFRSWLELSLWMQWPIKSIQMSQMSSGRSLADWIPWWTLSSETTKCRSAYDVSKIFISQLKQLQQL